MKVIGFCKWTPQNFFDIIQNWRYQSIWVTLKTLFQSSQQPKTADQGQKSFKKRVKLSNWDWINQLKFTSTSIYLNSIWLWHHSNPISCIVYTMPCWIPSWDSWSIGSSVSPSVSQSTKFHILYKSWLFCTLVYNNCIKMCSPCIKTSIGFVV